MTESPALTRPLDQAGDVGHHEVGVVVPHHAEVWLERRERVVGDLRPRRRDGGDQGALACVGEADQGHVGQQLELEVVVGLLPHFALLGEAGRPAGVGQESGVASTPLPAPPGQPPVPRVVEIGPHGSRHVVAHHRPRWHRDDQIVAPTTVAPLAAAVGAVARLTVRVIPEREQGAHVVVGDQPDVAAASAVAPVGSSAGNVGLAPERHRARAPVTCLDVELRLVDEGTRPGHRTSLRRPHPAARVVRRGADGCRARARVAAKAVCVVAACRQKVQTACQPNLRVMSFHGCAGQGSQLTWFLSST